MPDSTAVYVRRLIDMLLERGYLIADPDRMNVLVLARTGNALMRGRREFRVKLPKEKKPAAAKQYAALAEDVDEKLFDALRDVRTRLAARAGVPPYVIFSNATLADMAAKQPSSEFDLLSVRGVGDAKARRIRPGVSGSDSEIPGRKPRKVKQIENWKWRMENYATVSSVPNN